MTTPAPSVTPWPGHWVADALGLTVDDVPAELVGLALRRNPRRAHLVVSRVLGKHVPCDPRRVRATGLRLGDRVRAVLGGAGPERMPCVVLGFAENATALAQLVADALDAEYLVTSTRRVVEGATTLGAFHEPHSHAARHLLVPDDPVRWTPELPLVLVDDELSTGRTAVDALRLLHRTRGLPAVCVLAALVDLRDPDDDTVARAAAELGVRVEVVALAQGGLGLPADVLERGARLAAAHPDPPRPDGRGSGVAETVHLAPGPESARHGLDRAARAALEAALPDAVAHLAGALGPDPGRTLVLGTEELLYVPLRLAEGLADAGYDVRTAATTRSPAVVVDDPTYAIRSAVVFPAHDAGLGAARERYAYNLDHAQTVVVVVDSDARTPALHGPGGLLAQLRTVVPRVVEVVVPTRGPRAPVLPVLRGPAFGTFAPDEVGWLVTDLSALALETPTDERERAIRAGHHYSETLPEERAPSAAHEDVFRCALDRSAVSTARTVGVLTDRLLATRGPGAVLVSLARAGTPLGVLVRRWACRVRGIELPHVTVSVIRGRGLDRAALDALSAAYDPASLVFLDGWTGKGSIADEVAASVAAYRRETGIALDARVAALADPAHVAAVHGTRQDVLVPWACLNATVSGLVSRTLRRPDLVGPGAYDGAKCYPGLGVADRTAELLDALSACFEEVAPSSTPDDVPDRRGRAYVTALADELGLDPEVDDLRIKAGIGETTRMLLRRAPETVLLAPDAGAAVDHLRRLGRDRGVPIAALPAEAGGIAAPYRAVGVVRP